MPKKKAKKTDAKKRCHYCILIEGRDSNRDAVWKIVRQNHDGIKPDVGYACQECLEDLELRYPLSGANGDKLFRLTPAPISEAEARERWEKDKSEKAIEAGCHPLLTRAKVGDTVEYWDDDCCMGGTKHRESALIVALTAGGYECKFEMLHGTFTISHDDVIGIIKRGEG